MTSCRLLVCGSGLVGLAAALGFVRAGHNVQLLGPEPRLEPNPGDTYHPRVYALSPSSRSFLQSLGVWSLIDTDRVTPVQAMDVYGDGGGKVHLNAWQAASDTLAWIVESGELERVLVQAVKVFGLPWHTERFARLNPGAVLTDAQRELPFDLLVAADGARSALRQAAGIAHRSQPYGDMGVVVHLDAQYAHHHVAMQWFTGQSILALLPMPNTAAGHQVSMVWSMPQSQAQELLAQDFEGQRAWLEPRLAAVSGGRLGALRMRRSALGFPLTLETSDMIAPGVALVGDAAHRVHPLAGQGLNLGFGDVEALISVLTEKEPWRSAGDARVLARYRRARAEPVFAMRWATHGLYGLFAQPSAPIAALRNAGMAAIDGLPFVKRLLIRAAQ